MALDVRLLYQLIVFDDIVWRSCAVLQRRMHGLIVMVYEAGMLLLAQWHRRQPPEHARVTYVFRLRAFGLTPHGLGPRDRHPPSA